MHDARLGHNNNNTTLCDRENGLLTTIAGREHSSLTIDRAKHLI
jgi:hypothetical protein